nr:hypothetical protein [Tanacetum cinerariifolium]
MNPQGGSAAGYGEAHNRVENVNQGQARPGQARTVKCYNCNGGQDNAFDDDVDEQPVQNLALNMDNVFQAEDYDAFDSYVDEAPTAQTMFMANLSSADPITDEARPSYDLDILSEVRDHDQYLDDTCAYQEEHVMHDSDLALNVDNVFQAEDCDAFHSDVDEAPTAQTMFMANLSSADPITDKARPSYDLDILSEEEHVMHDSVQLDHVVDLHADHTNVSNMIPYD